MKDYYMDNIVLHNTFKMSENEIQTKSENNIEFIYNIIKSFNFYKVKILKINGYIHCSYDIIYKIKKYDNYKGIQIKTLTLDKKDKKVTDAWKFYLSKANINKTLLVGLNNEENRFVLIFREDCPKTAWSCNYETNNTKYEYNKFINLKKFEQQLYYYLPYSNTFYEQEIKRKEIISVFGPTKISEQTKEDINQCKYEKNVEFIYNIIKSFNFYDVKIINYTNCSYDIVYKINKYDNYKGIQIRLLHLDDRRKYVTDAWRFYLSKIHKNFTLLVALNEEQNRFTLIFREDCAKTIWTCNYGKNDTMYENNKFIDLKKFKQQLFYYLPYSNI
jgi:hypothetical protein